MCKKIYIAMPMTGLTFSQIKNKIKLKKKELKNFLIIDPLDGINCGLADVRFENSEIAMADYSSDRRISNKLVFDQCKLNVADCDIILADFTGAEKISIGTCMEIAFAHVHGKKIVVIMEYDNIHRHCFILESASNVYERFENAMDCVEESITHHPKRERA